MKTSENDSPVVPTVIFESRADGDAADMVLMEPSSRARSRQRLRVVAALLTTVAAFVLGAWVERRSTKPVASPPLVTMPAPLDTNDAPALTVHVAGAVKKPGVYRLPRNARVHQAIERAGGSLPNADTQALNLAAWAEDGARIEVPRRRPSGENAASATALPADAASDFEPASWALKSAAGRGTERPAAAQKYFRRTTTTRLRETQPTIAQRAETQGAGAQRAQARRSANAAPEHLQRHPIDLNRATRAELESLPGVGPALAQRILDFRAENGGFKAVSDLDEVRGIGDKKLQLLEPLVIVR